MNGSIEAVEAVRASALTGAASDIQQPGGTAAPGFANWISHEVDALNGQLVSAEQGVQKLATGQAANLHDVMLQLEQARLAMQLAAQVRSRVLEAYQEVMRMQV